MRIFITMVALCVLPIAGYAQQISVVDPIGQTTVYTDLNTAIYEAPAGSMVYLSGGGFAINDTSKITKPLTIMGIGHRFDNDNADGSTIVSGNIFFNPGSDGSALLGIHLSGNVNIGGAYNGIPVNNILLRFCNVASVIVTNSYCQNVHINQNYVRNNIGGTSTNSVRPPLYVSNNITGSITWISAGVIEHNVIRNGTNSNYYDYITNSHIKNNISFKNSSNAWALGGACTGNVISNNMVVGTAANIATLSLYGNNCLSSLLTGAFLGTVFDIDPVNNFHLKETCVGKNAATDGTDIGIYGGTGFSDKALPPGPRIIFKKVAHQTDHDGNLPVEIKVSVE